MCTNDEKVKIANFRNEWNVSDRLMFHNCLKFRNKWECKWASYVFKLRRIQEQITMCVVALYFRSTVLHSLTELSSTFNIVFRPVFTLPRQPHDFAYYYQDSVILLLLLAGLVLPMFQVMSVIVLITFYGKICTSSSSFKRDIR